MAWLLTLETRRYIQEQNLLLLDSNKPPIVAQSPHIKTAKNFFDNINEVLFPFPLKLIDL